MRVGKVLAIVGIPEDIGMGGGSVTVQCVVPGVCGVKESGMSHMLLWATS